MFLPHPLPPPIAIYSREIPWWPPIQKLTRPGAPESPSTALRETPSFSGHTPFGAAQGPRGLGGGRGKRQRNEAGPDPGEIAASVGSPVALPALAPVRKRVASGSAGGMRLVFLSHLIRLKGGKESGVWARASSFPTPRSPAAPRRESGWAPCKEGTRPNPKELSLPGSFLDKDARKAGGNSFGLPMVVCVSIGTHQHNRSLFCQCTSFV